jgi:putative DNA primase/helicase
VHENYEQVVHAMEQIGCVFRRNDLPLRVDEGRKKTCGKGGKFWYRLFTFAPRASSRRFVVGSYGSYKDGSSFKVEWDRAGLSEEAREQYQREKAAAREREKREAEEAAATAALSAGQLWHRLARGGSSPYLDRKGVEPEACRFVSDWLRIARLDDREKPFVIPPGSIALPLIRYDLPRDEALRGLQFIKPDGFKLFTEGIGKRGCSVRLGEISDATLILLVCEGYATGLSLRAAIARRWPVFVSLDAGNLLEVVPLLRELYPNTFILVCADDDWKTKNHDGPNPGRTAGRKISRATSLCDMVWPVFEPRRRQLKDTDFNDLHVREGLEEVEQQIGRTLRLILSREFGMAECDGV